MTPDFTITIDTREPKRGNWTEFFKAPYERATLRTGDYSIRGLDTIIAIERKTMPDLLGCLTRDRERFEAELFRAQSYALFAVIIEGDLRDLSLGRYRSKMSATAAFESVVALQVRNRVPFLFANDRETAAQLCESMLCRWLKENPELAAVACQDDGGGVIGNDEHLVLKGARYAS